MSKFMDKDVMDASMEPLDSDTTDEGLINMLRAIRVESARGVINLAHGADVGNELAGLAAAVVAMSLALEHHIRKYSDDV